MGCNGCAKGRDNDFVGVNGFFSCLSEDFGDDGASDNAADE